MLETELFGVVGDSELSDPICWLISLDIGAGSFETVIGIGAEGEIDTEGEVSFLAGLARIEYLLLRCSSVEHAFSPGVFPNSGMLSLF